MPGRWWPLFICLLHGTTSLFICFWTASDTRYECISTGQGGDRFGDDYEPPDFDFGRGLGMTRTISCPRSKSGSILVLRVGYGSSVIPGRCESVSYCKEEYDTGDVIAERCDGRSTCYVDQMLPRYMPCGRMSNYMMVEYECVDSKAILCSAILTHMTTFSMVLHARYYPIIYMVNSKCSWRE